MDVSLPNDVSVVCIGDVCMSNDELIAMLACNEPDVLLADVAVGVLEIV